MRNPYEHGTVEFEMYDMLENLREQLGAISMAFNEKRMDAMARGSYQVREDVKRLLAKARGEVNG